MNYKNIPTFKDLSFKTTESPKGIQCRFHFKNGYGVSVVRNTMSYTDSSNEYELAVLKNNTLCYKTKITNDVLGYLSPIAVSKIMKQIQKLPSIKKKV